MKTMIGAIALVIAAPVAAQTAPASPQAGHAQHQQQGHAQHGQTHGQMQGQQHGQHQGMHGECCKQVNGKMECQMMKGHGSHQGGQGQHQGHSGH